jgi:hypothetical protein
LVVVVVVQVLLASLAQRMWVDDGLGKLRSLRHSSVAGGRTTFASQDGFILDPELNR